MEHVIEYTEANLRELVQQSKSYKELHRRSRHTVYSTANYKRIKQLIQLYNIDTSHFLSNGDRTNIKRRKLTDEIMFSKTYLTKNRIGAGGNTNKLVIRRLIELGKVYHCDHCGISDWNGKSLRLQLEHIDGDSLNYERDNLAFLCPNCHSQTDTFAGKNKKKEQTIDANIN